MLTMLACVRAHGPPSAYDARFQFARIPADAHDARFLLGAGCLRSLICVGLSVG